MVHAAVTHQMQRPKLARLIDFEERRLPIGSKLARVSNLFHTALQELLTRKDAPVVEDRTIAAHDLLAITKGIVDSAGERHETNAQHLQARVRKALSATCAARAHTPFKHSYFFARDRTRITMFQRSSGFSRSPSPGICPLPFLMM